MIQEERHLTAVTRQVLEAPCMEWPLVIVGNGVKGGTA